MPASQYAAPPAMQIDPSKAYAATLETSQGTFVADLFPAEAPATDAEAPEPAESSEEPAEGPDDATTTDDTTEE